MSALNGQNKYQATEWLKGFAILIVIISHLSRTYNDAFFGPGYANGAISIFFVLSGYGAYFSLKRRFASNADTVKTIAIYYTDRVLRIFILYEPAAGLVQLVTKQPYSFLMIFLCLKGRRYSGLSEQ